MILATRARTRAVRTPTSVSTCGVPVPGLLPGGYGQLAHRRLAPEGKQLDYRLGCCSYVPGDLRYPAAAWGAPRHHVLRRHTQTRDCGDQAPEHVSTQTPLCLLDSFPSVGSCWKARFLKLSRDFPFTARGTSWIFTHSGLFCATSGVFRRETHGVAVTATAAPTPLTPYLQSSTAYTIIGQRHYPTRPPPRICTISPDRVLLSS
ncbi:hypothetical protein BC834DRAFT_90187 [Gloeopeniophorella convolvens]|nr:hypothetical protein BC834DRAFT_90187 [Gloeopeniophorella convolvens]